MDLRIFGVILAGGQGRRMGGADKAFLPLAGRSLIRHVLDRLRPQVDSVILSANGDASRFDGLGCMVVPDEASQGPLSGILATLRHARAPVKGRATGPSAPLEAVAVLVDGRQLPAVGAVESELLAQPAHMGIDRASGDARAQVPDL